MARAAAIVLLLLVVAAPAAAQPQEEPWRPPIDPSSQVTANRDRTTSGPAATAPSPAEQREARVLAGAVFAKPAAAERAADKAAPVVEPDLGQVQPKPEWTSQSGGVGIGGKGVQVKTPF